jgi:hypothetical protein
MPPVKKRKPLKAPTPVVTPTSAVTLTPAVAPAAVSTPTPIPLEPDPNCGHQPRRKWPNEFTVIFNQESFKHYNDNKWRIWDPANHTVIGEEDDEIDHQILETQSDANYKN